MNCVCGIAVPSKADGRWQPVIGLEVHAQLATRTKIFCSCATEFGTAPNSRTCPTCLGHPGALPVVNARALELAARAALALGCELRPHSVFARKHYFYPDLPKGYQITQYEEPIALGGSVTIELDEGRREIGLIRLHLEEDAGKSIHEGTPDSDQHSHVDLNRAGTPLIEIVSRPELRTPAEAYLFLERLRSMLRYVGVCNANMERGELRCDANISIRPRGSDELGTRTELKNLNSFRNVERALTWEIERQAAVLESGGQVEQQTVLWDAAAGVTRPMRDKEESRDYRYFPDPDLPPVVLDPAWIEARRAELVDLPATRKRKLIELHGLDPREAHLLTLERQVVDYFEEVARLCGNPRAAANFIVNDIARCQNDDGLEPSEIPLPAGHLAELIDLVDSGKASPTVARRELLPNAWRSGRSPSELLESSGLRQVSDDVTLRALVHGVIAQFPEQVAQYRAGKTGLLGFLIGHAVKASGGKANPARLNELLREEIG